MNGLREITKIRPLQKWIAAPFSKLLLIREESGEVFNIRKMLLFHTNPTVYHTLNSDQRLKGYHENGACGSFLPELQCSEFSSAVLFPKILQFEMLSEYLFLHRCQNRPVHTHRNIY